jgi:hypothetical protein
MVEIATKKIEIELDKMLKKVEEELELASTAKQERKLERASLPGYADYISAKAKYIEAFASFEAVKNSGDFTDISQAARNVASLLDDMQSTANIITKGIDFSRQAYSDKKKEIQEEYLNL